MLSVHDITKGATPRENIARMIFLSIFRWFLSICRLA